MSRLIRMFFVLRGAATLALACLGVGSTHAQEEIPWQFTGAERIVAVADIHGAADAFETILQRAALIDESLRWRGGNDHLVIVGDVLDRGPDSRRALDLIMRLQDEATRAGGAVHFVLGNHEVMNIVGDLRYVAAAEYAAFAADETAAMRTEAFDLLYPPTPDETQLQSLRAEFDTRHPPGFFAHRDAFSPDGQYGAWLLRQAFLVTIDDFAFVHGGIAGTVAGAPNIQELNATLRREVAAYAVAVQVLIREGLLGQSTNFYEHTARIAEFAERVAAGEVRWPGASETAANIVADLSASLAFDAGGPAWYRGNVACTPLIEADRLEATLAMAGARHLVIGHTPNRDGSIHSRLNAGVFRIDTGMLSEYYGGRAAALVIEGDRTFAIYEDAIDPVPIEAQDRSVGRRPAGMAPAEFEQLLGAAPFTDAAPDDGQLDQRWRPVRLRQQGIELTAAFTRTTRRGFSPDIAAWRLDRLLGLEMVPTVIIREFDGDDGTLQYVPPQTITEAQRQAERLGGAAWCPLADQFTAMYVFDALIGNTGRTLERLRYTTDSFNLILLGHDLAFSQSGELPPHLVDVEFVLTPAWIEALQSLDEALLEAQFADVLDRRRRRALLERRDRLLESARVRR